MMCSVSSAAHLARADESRASCLKCGSKRRLKPMMNGATGPPRIGAGGARLVKVEIERLFAEDRLAGLDRRGGCNSRWVSVELAMTTPAIGGVGQRVVELADLARRSPPRAPSAAAGNRIDDVSQLQSAASAATLAAWMRPIRPAPTRAMLCIRRLLLQP